jgi:hypothetical protein
MTITSADQPSRTAADARPRRVGDLRRFRRYAAAVVVLLPALCVAAARLFRTEAASTRAALDQIAGNPDRQFTFAVLGYIGLFTALPAFLAVARLSRRRRPTLTVAALTANNAAFLGAFAMSAIDTLYLIGALLPPEQRDVAAGVIDRLWSSGLAGFSTDLFAGGHIVGAILMGLALRGSIPTLGWLAMLLTTPAHVVVFVVLQMPVLDLLSWLLMTVSFGYCALAIVRTPDGLNDSAA